MSTQALQFQAQTNRQLRQAQSIETSEAQAYRQIQSATIAGYNPTLGQYRCVTPDGAAQYAGAITTGAIGRTASLYISPGQSSIDGVPY